MFELAEQHVLVLLDALPQPRVLLLQSLPAGPCLCARCLLGLELLGQPGDLGPEGQFGVLGLPCLLLPVLLGLEVVGVVGDCVLGLLEHPFGLLVLDDHPAHLEVELLVDLALHLVVHQLHELLDDVLEALQAAALPQLLLERAVDALQVGRVAHRLPPAPQPAGPRRPRSRRPGRRLLLDDLEHFDDEAQHAGLLGQGQQSPWLHCLPEHFAHLALEAPHDVVGPLLPLKQLAVLQQHAVDEAPHRDRTPHLEVLPQEGLGLRVGVPLAPLALLGQSPPRPGALADRAPAHHAAPRLRVPLVGAIAGSVVDGILEGLPQGRGGDPLLDAGGREGAGGVGRPGGVLGGEVRTAGRLLEVVPASALTQHSVIMLTGSRLLMQSMSERSGSKRERKREKQAEKELLFRPPPGKLHYEDCPIPPYSQDQLRAVLLEYLAYEVFEVPCHHISLAARLRAFYHSFQNADIYMKDLDLPEVLADLQQANCLTTSHRALGTKLVTIVERVHLRNTYLEYLRQKDLRPSVPPPDPITFQQQRKELSAKEKEHRKKLESLLSAPSLFGGRIDVEAEMENFGSFEAKVEALEQQSRRSLEYCDHCTRERCQRAKGHGHCPLKHFRALINQNTDESFGNCPHLNACHNPDCKLIHYVEEDQQGELALEREVVRERMGRAEWINCDLRYFDFKVLGKFDVVMADPPWDIHMSLPYGTLKDKELLNLRVDILQDQGLIFLWVTGRAMELGRECLSKWGYRRVDELVWIKTNQINRLIITGKTGHWLNHTKEHCLVGVKGEPRVGRHLDCDVIVSKVRETSRKPDEVYGMIERMSPGGKKIELFGRPDNCMPGWLTLGNQLTEVRLKDEGILGRMRQAHPAMDLSEERMQRNLEEMLTQDNLNKIYNNHIHKGTV